ncbi:MAG: response regulator [Cyanobacteriota bacterium]|nr:response regulator [Cyanobacteriota bacterium]
MNPKRILAIDDEPGVRDIIQICLEAVAGWDVLTAASGKEGIAIARDEQPDAILLDVMMPGMDGPSTFRSLQADPQTQHLPTILLTAKIKMSERQQYLDLGVAGVISKPFEARGLVDRICEILNWSQKS